MGLTNAINPITNILKNTAGMNKTALIFLVFLFIILVLMFFRRRLS